MTLADKIWWAYVVALGGLGTAFICFSIVVWINLREK